MANEFHHLDIGSSLTKTEWEATDTHTANNQADRDMLYYDGSGWIRHVSTPRVGTLVVAASDASQLMLDVADYVCDGTADDVQIQQAIDALATTGGTVVLSEGIFTLAAVLTARSNIKFLGMGYGNTVVKSAAGQQYLMKETAAGISNVEFESITFQAVTAARSVEAIGVDLSILTTAATNITFRNCRFIDFVYTSGTPSGIRGKYTGLLVDGCIFSSTGGSNSSYPIYLNGGSDIRIIGSMFTTAFAGNCIYAYNNSNVKIAGNSLTTSDLTVAIELIDLEGITDAAIVGNRFYNASIDGILIGGDATPGACTGINITGNTFKSCGKTHAARRAAVSVGTAIACTEIIINSNFASDCESGIARIGESGQNYANEVLVVGNRVDACNYPMVLYGNNYVVRLVANDLSGNSNGLIAATGTLFARDNLGYVSENSGSATVISGNTTVVVNHGLATTPTRVLITSTTWGNAAKAWVSTLTSTQFTINVDANPGIATAIFDWRAQVGEG